MQTKTTKKRINLTKTILPYVFKTIYSITIIRLLDVIVHVNIICHYSVPLLGLIKMNVT